MDKTLQIQMQIRQNADEISSALKDMKQWEKNMKGKDKKLHEQKKTVPRRSGGGTVPLRTFTPSAAPAQSILTPATLFEKSISEKLNNAPNVTESVPKALGTYQEKEAEEVERERGNTEFKNGNFAAAVKSYTKCLGLKRQNYVAFSNRAMAYLKLKEYNKAIVDCNCALSIEPTHVKSLMRRATAFNALGKHRAALKDLLDAAELEPSNKQLKLDMLQTKEMLRNAVNRAPLVAVPDFAQIIRDFGAITAENVSTQETAPEVEPVLLQGPELPAVLEQKSEPEKVTDLSGYHRIAIEEADKEDEEEEGEIDVPKTIIDNSKEERNKSDAGNSIPIEIVEEEEQQPQPQVEPIEIIEEEPVQLTSMRIQIVAEDDEDDTQELHQQNKKPMDNEGGNKKSKTSSSKKSVKKNSPTKKKKSDTDKTPFPKTSYELEKLLSSATSFEEIQFLYNESRQKNIISIFKSCYEPEALYLFLNSLSRFLPNSSPQWQKIVFQTYSTVAQVPNFSMLFSLLQEKEKIEIIENIRQLAESDRSHQFGNWDDLTAVYH